MPDPGVYDEPGEQPAGASPINGNEGSPWCHLNQPARTYP